MTTTANKGYWVGVDLGGTKILSGVFDHRMHCLWREKVATKANRGWREVVSRIERCVRKALEEAGLRLEAVAGIGVGAPGAVRSPGGEIVFSGNLDWREVPLQEELERRLGCPVFVENDGNVATLGIYEMELGSRPPHVIGIFLGTGIGGGVVLNGELYSGSNHTAGEFGHMVLDVDGELCSCGNRGCFEALAGRRAIFRKIQAGIRGGRKTVLTELGKDLTKLRSRDLRKAIKRRDALVAETVHETARYTGIAVANLMNAFNPHTVVLGGGLIEALEPQLMPTIAEQARAHAFPGTAESTAIVASKLSDDAGIFGASVLARRLAPPAECSCRAGIA